MILATHGIVGSQIQSFVGLLDTYPNAAAAYSVRKLRTAYTGSAIRVRRSSDNAESDIGFSGGNLDTTSLTSFCGAANGFVTTWYDQSGNARNATQTTAANQPQIVSSGSIISENTKPTLQFDGTNDSFSISSPVLTGATVFATFITCNFKGVNTYEMLLTQSDGTVANDRFEIRRDSSTNVAEYLANTTGSNKGTININNKQILSSYLGNSPTINAYINNSLDVSNTGLSFSITNNAAIIGARGSSFYFNGVIQEMMIYATNQSSNRIGIQSEINNYYAIY